LHPEYFYSSAVFCVVFFRTDTMKKWIAGLVTVLILATASVYIFIPSTIRVRKVMQVNANEKGIYPFLYGGSSMAKWWPGESTPGGKIFTFNNSSYTLSEQLYGGVKMNVSGAKGQYNTEMQVVPLDINNIEISWTSALPGGNDPFSRISNYNKAANIKKDMEAILLRLKGFLEKMENIYDIKVERSKVKDTLLITMQKTVTMPPGNAVVYEMISKLRQHFLAAGATATGDPILNVFTEDSISYKTMVGIPINKEVPETDVYRIKRMIPGNVLVAEVKGGPATIRHSLQQLDVYRVNYNYTAPAKPFEALVTNRLAETDTAKWITRLYWPVY
jgi:hypothetical protein